MANINNTRLTCSDMQRFTEILENKWMAEIKKKHDAGFDKDKGELCAETRWGVLDDEIYQMSKENPDLTFTADFSFEGDWYSVIHKVEFRDGEAKEVDQIPVYMDCTLRDTREMGDHYEKLLNVAKGIFRRVDTEVFKDGTKMICFNMNKIAVTVQDEDFLMIISKMGSTLNIDECFRKAAPALHKIATEVR